MRLFFLSMAVLFSGCLGGGPAGFPANQSGSPANASQINSFEECAAAGYPVMESYPRQCRGPDGRTFVSAEDLAAINQGGRENATGDDIQESRLRRQCCEECIAAYSQSPIAVGPHGAQCGHFMTGKPISAECADYFEAHPSTVSRCG